MINISRFLRLIARYSENPSALRVKLNEGTPETFWKLDRPWFHGLGLKAVIDVGGNEGQFATTIRSLLPEVQIFSFEPIPECALKIRKKFAGDKAFQLFDCALGDTPGKAVLSVSVISGASSLLEMSSIQSRHFPKSLKRSSITVDVKTLDQVIKADELPVPYLLKIDVQGFEYQVLAGAATTLANATLVLLEASFEPFYEGQKLFGDIYEILHKNGFHFRDSFNMMYDTDTGRALQGDFLFERAT